MNRIILQTTRNDGDILYILCWSTPSLAYDNRKNATKEPVDFMYPSAIDFTIGGKEWYFYDYARLNISFYLRNSFVEADTDNLCSIILAKIYRNGSFYKANK